MSGQGEPINGSDCIDAEAVYDLIIWNAPDHEHTRHQLRRALEAVIEEKFALYHDLDGDRYQGLVGP